MINNGNNTAAFVLNVIALVHGSFACIISSITFIIIIWHEYKDRMKRQDRITLILCGNIYLMIFLQSLTLVSMNIHTLLGDLYGENFDSPWCTFRAYFLLAMFCAIYYGFVDQVSSDYAYIHSYVVHEKEILHNGSSKDRSVFIYKKPFLYIRK
jgi:hypothetical protein